MGQLDSLLAVQTLDTRLDQLRHRREHLPEREELAQVRAALDASRAKADVVGGRLRELRASQKALEDEAATIEEKAQRAEAHLYDGSVVAHKELEALQADHRMLKRQQSELEDRAIEVMEQAEPVEAELAGFEAELAELAGRLAGIEDRILVAETEIDAEADRLMAERESAAAEVPPEVLTSYEPLRQRLGGIGAAKLTGARCDGCHLEIPSAELEQVRHAPDDAVVTCPECGRILVR